MKIVELIIKKFMRHILFFCFVLFCFFFNGELHQSPLRFHKMPPLQVMADMTFFLIV